MNNTHQEIIPVIEPKIIYPSCEFELSGYTYVIHIYDWLTGRCKKCDKIIGESKLI